MMRVMMITRCSGAAMTALAWVQSWIIGLHHPRRDAFTCRFNAALMSVHADNVCDQIVGQHVNCDLSTLW